MTEVVVMAPLLIYKYIPMINVVAKPRIGPVPKEYKITPVRRVVTFASIIALFEFL